MEGMWMTPRRVVTGKNRQGKSYFVHDGPTPGKLNLGMHTTRSIDYGIVLSGEIDLELDEGTAHLKPGDVVVQRRTRHAWHIPGTKPCTTAFVMINNSKYQ